MSFQEKYNDYKQKKEARAFFNRNNNEKVYGKDYIIALLVGMAASIVLGFIMEWVTFKIGFNFSYFTIVVGILQAGAIKKVLNKSGFNLAILAIVTYILGVLIAQTLYQSILLPIFNLQLFVDIFVVNFKYMIIGDFLNTIIYLFGAIASYLALKD